MSDDGPAEGGRGRGGMSLGQLVAGRFRRPGPPLSRPRPSPIGSVAMAATRFAAATAHSPEVRRSLRGPEPVRARSVAGNGVQPPRWWQYWWSSRSHDESAARAPALPALPPRGLPRVVRTGHADSARPGHMVGGLAGDVARVRRPPEVTSVGPMLVERERVASTAPPNRAPTNSVPSNRAPGNRAGETGTRPAAQHTSAADLSASVVRRMSATAPSAQAAAAIARSSAAAGQATSIASPSTGAVPARTGQPAPAGAASPAPAGTSGSTSGSTSGRAPTTAAAVGPAAFGHAVAAAAPSPPLGRWGALRHAATPRSRAAAAAAAVTAAPASTTRSTTASTPRPATAATAGASVRSGAAAVVRRSIATTSSSTPVTPAPAPSALAPSSATSSRATPSGAAPPAADADRGATGATSPALQPAPGETAARGLGGVDPLMAAIDTAAPRAFAPTRPGAPVGLRRVTGPALSVAAATARRALPSAPSLAAMSAATRTAASAGPDVVRRSPAAAAATAAAASPSATSRSSASRSSAQAPASPSATQSVPASSSGRHAATAAVATKSAPADATPSVRSSASYPQAGGLALASIGGLARTGSGDEPIGAAARGPALLRAAGSTPLDFSTATVRPASTAAMRSVAPAAGTASTSVATSRASATTPGAVVAATSAARGPVVRRFPSARPGATTAAIAPRDIPVATRLPAWLGTAAARAASVRTSTSVTTSTSSSAAAATPPTSAPASRRSWPVIPPRSARPATAARGPQVPAAGRSAGGDESAVVRRSLVDRTSHLFDSGTKSGETPRTGASAPSLSSMGAADTRVAGQPVVRRLLADAPSVDASNATTGGANTSESRPDPDRVALDNGELFERIVDALEQRVLDELERRGHRRAPGVY
jgi:hypothetical protein